MSIEDEISQLAEKLVIDFRHKGHFLATVESCTGGLLSAAITSISGASEMFGYGFVTYANEAKESLVDVPADLLKQYGAVSSEVAIAMAKGALVKAKANVAISITGIAGPKSDNSDKPVGLVFFGLARKSQSEIVTKYHREELRGLTRGQFRQQAVCIALSLLNKLGEEE